MVIDNANRIAEQTPQILKFLQDYAKDAADTKWITFVFVMSDGPLLLQGTTINNEIQLQVVLQFREPRR